MPYPPCDEQEQIVELGADLTKSTKGKIYTLTIIGQVEGHQVAPETVKTTKYEHVIPSLAQIEDDKEIDIIPKIYKIEGALCVYNQEETFASKYRFNSTRC